MQTAPIKLTGHKRKQYLAWLEKTNNLKKTLNINIDFNY
jgi:hypothetical protein